MTTSSPQDTLLPSSNQVGLFSRWEFKLRPLLRGCVKLAGWVLGMTGSAVLVLGAMIAVPLTSPPPLASIYETARTVDRSTMPGVQRFQARDGTSLAYRHYSARGAAVGRIAVLVHGSTGSSSTVHALADALAARGVDTYAPDTRGHGGSGTRGDIGYVGQLEDDLADLVAEIRKVDPATPLTLIGHSAGGGFALRVAGSPIQNLFARAVLLAPYLGYTAPTNRPNSGGWANADMPRIIALMLLRGIGIDCCGELPTLAYAVPPNSAGDQTPVYSDRLRLNFGTHRDFRSDLATATVPVTIYSGAQDELMIADKYAEAVRDFPRVDVRLVDGANHMAIVSTPQAVAVVADDIATR
jgi:alpha-beta hydrolase superfamily lysophospholipase